MEASDPARGAALAASRRGLGSTAKFLQGMILTLLPPNSRT
jgi:hypothetical protein